MNFVLRAVFALIAIAILSSCANGPTYDKATIYYDRPTFVDSVTHDDPSIAEKVIQHGRCTLNIASTPDAKMAPQDFCIFALTRDALHVLKWNANDTRYERLTTVNFKNVEQVALASQFRHRQVQMIEKKRVVAFSVIIDDGGIFDADATSKVFDVVAAAGIPVATSKGMIVPPRRGGAICSDLHREVIR